MTVKDGKPLTLDELREWLDRPCPPKRPTEEEIDLEFEDPFQLPITPHSNGVHK